MRISVCLSVVLLVAPAMADDSDQAWNEAYQAGFDAILDEDYAGAETHMRLALAAARSFGPRDWRLAETFDELGLIAYQLGDYELAERMQGTAIAEMLLAVGPQGEPLRGDETPIRPDCRSGLSVYMERLGWIHEQLRGEVSVEELRVRPWRVFAAGYLTMDAQLADRLDWLVSQYLLQENLEAARELGELQRRLRAR